MSGAGTAAAAIELRDAGKRYAQLSERPTLVASLLPFRRAARRDLWALRHADLRVERGETVGVLGRNGAGKSTMLRLLAGVTQPSEGSVIIDGRVAPLLSVGVGFHAEMTGRENVYVNGMLLGLTREQIDDRFNDIVAFAELGEFIDTPVKFYSSGMFMRLGFSVAIHVDPDLLLVDEILAVGDIAFQLKCFDRMRAMQRAGTTIVLVSHSMHAIRLLCPRAVLLGGGQLLFDGPSEAAIARHHELLTAEVAASTGGEAAVVVERAELVDRHGAPVHAGRQDEPLVLRLTLRFDADVDSPQLWFHVLSEDGTLAYEMKSAIGRRHRAYRAGDRAEAQVNFTPRLGGGSWRLSWTIADREGRAAYVRSPGVLLYLAPPLGSAGIADLGATITLDGEVVSDHEALTLDGT